MVKHKIIICMLLLQFFFISQYSIFFSVISDSDSNYLLISESTFDYELSNHIKLDLGENCTTLDIDSSENLNTLFLNNSYFSKFNSIFLIMDKITRPFNETLISSLQDFINDGGSFVIISSQIWKFPTSFHNLLGISISTKISKEFPTGNSTSSINMTLSNNFANSFYIEGK